MNILYGVVGEGMGHATRSKVVITYLISKGHRVLAASHGRAAIYLSEAGIPVTRADGLGLTYADGAVDLVATAAQNLAGLPGMLAMGATAWREFERFRPDLVISDFDSLTSLFGRTHNIPVISIDNMQIIDRCVHSPAAIHGYEGDYEIARMIVAARVPNCLAYVITTFFYPPKRLPCTLVPPILRAEILQARPTDQGHVLVYRTQASDRDLLGTLGRADARFIVYGLNGGPAPANVTLKPFSERGFVDDLASCSAVLANGGMSLLGEALYLGKPVYVVPVGNHAEQEMNSRYLSLLGYGVTSARMDADTLNSFLANRAMYVDAIRADGRQDGNRVLYETLDGLL